MRLTNLETHFPELLALPEGERELVVEEARYDVFVTRKLSGTWVVTTTGAMVLSGAVGIGSSIAAELITGSSPLWVAAVAGLVTAPVYLWFQEKRYVELLRPTVAEMCKERAR